MKANHIETVKGAEHLRKVIAHRRDRLVSKQRGGFSPARQKLIDSLGDQYRTINSISIEAGRVD